MPETTLTEEQRLKMYVWTDQVSFLAVAHAASVADAQEQVLTYELPGEARAYVMEQSPAIYVGRNAEFTLSDSAELREQEEYAAQLNKQVKFQKKEIERLRRLAANVKGAIGIAREEIREAIGNTNLARIESDLAAL